MNSIEIKYFPLPLLPWERTVSGSYPEKWEEVSARQLIAIARNIKGEIDNLSFLHCMTGVNKRLLKKLSAFRLYKINELFNFIADRKEYNSFILNKITIEGLHFYPPHPKLKKMSFGQFIFAETHFGNWQDKHEPAEAARFMAALYLPHDFKFTEDIIEENMHVFKKTDPVTFEAVTLNYLLIKQWLTQIYPLVFQHDDGEALKNGVQKKQRDPMAWVKIFETLVGDDLINQDRWAEMPVHNIFRYMSHKIKETIKRK